VGAWALVTSSVSAINLERWSLMALVAFPCDSINTYVRVLAGPVLRRLKDFAARNGAEHPAFLAGVDLVTLIS
jgi:hypothetical protein